MCLCVHMYISDLKILPSKLEPLGEKKKNLSVSLKSLSE